jgi:hypothetical protein
MTSDLIAEFDALAAPAREVVREGLRRLFQAQDREDHVRRLTSERETLRARDAAIERELATLHAESD